MKMAKAEIMKLSEARATEQEIAEWGDPVNVFDDFSLGTPKWQTDYCPEIISDFAYDEAERMGVLPEQIAGPANIVAAGVIDDDFNLQPKAHDFTIC